MTNKKLKPCDCKDSESIEKLNESGIWFNEDSITLDRNCVILQMSHTQVRIPASDFKMFAEWYLDESKIEEKWNEVLKAIENSTPKKDNTINKPKQEITIGEYRLIPKGTKFWSIKNQTDILLDEDAIIEINQTCHGSDAVFVTQKQLIFNFAGYFPTIIGRGSDEWSISYSKTLEYTVPEYNPLIFTYNE